MHSPVSAHRVLGAVSGPSWSSRRGFDRGCGASPGAQTGQTVVCSEQTIEPKQGQRCLVTVSASRRDDLLEKAFDSSVQLTN